MSNPFESTERVNMSESFDLENNYLVEYSKLFDLTAERSVLGSCLLDPTALVRIADTLAPVDFFRETNQYVFDAMQALSDTQVPIDPITLWAEIERRGKGEAVGGQVELLELIAEVPSALYVEHYAKIVADKAVLRRLNAAASGIAQTVFKANQTAEQAVDEAEQILFAVSQGRKQRAMEHIGGPLARMIASLENNGDGPVGIQTGYKDIDKILGGFQRSDLIFIAARPGMGKSSLALGIADNVSLADGAVVIFSLEMSKDQFAQRHLSMRTGIDSHRIRMKKIHDDEWPIVLEVANEISQQNIHIDDTAGLSVDALRREARRLAANGGIDLIVIDYLQLMSGEGGKGGNREQEIAYISRNLKAMARELDVAVVVLSQLSRAVESRADKRPLLSDLRESGSQEQDADVVMFIYREDYYDEDSDQQNIAEVIVRKHRHGDTGTARLLFKKELTLFCDLEVHRTELN